MKNTFEKSRTEIRIKNIQKEINSLVDKYLLSESDEEKNIIKQKVDNNTQLIEKLKKGEL